MESYGIYKKIYELRESGYTYKEIQEELAKNGNKISVSKIQTMAKAIYEELEKEEPTFVSDEVIYNLRKQGLTYSEMSEELLRQGKRITTSTLCCRCKKIFKEKNEKVPKGSSLKISDEEIFNLREKRQTYEKISEYFKQKGINTSIGFIQRRCKAIYAEKGLKEPKSEHMNSKLDSNFDKEIVRLRENEGLSYKKIAEHFTDRDITRQAICNRYQRIENYNSKVTAKMIFNLVASKKATIEQIKIIAEYYGVDLEKTMNSIEDR